MIFYLTYNDLPNGIFSSQVIDVIKYLNHNFKSNIKLISFISIRNFFSNRKKIKNEIPNAIILPMFPGFYNWKYNIWLLKLFVLFKKPHSIIGRSVLATQLALQLKKDNYIKTVIYDGRGAISEEWKEYKVVADLNLLNDIHKLEMHAVLNSDFCIAVSDKLIKYWRYKFEYEKNNYVVIPCTLNTHYEKISISDHIIASSKINLDISIDDICFVYSGSTASWQSFNLIYDFIKPILRSGMKYKIIFLCETNKYIDKLKKEFTTQIICKQVNPIDVSKYLLAADYGILIREHSVTNQVASPVKFAEYLACGLKICISDNLGDYSSLIKDNTILGHVLNNSLINYSNVLVEDKIKIKNFGITTFSKNSFNKAYQILINNINACK